MTPPPGSVASAPLSTHVPYATAELAVTDNFADRRWTSDTDDGNSVWSAASYWVRRKRAAARADGAS